MFTIRVLLSLSFFFLKRVRILEYRAQSSMPLCTSYDLEVTKRVTWLERSFILHPTLLKLTKKVAVGSSGLKAVWQITRR